MNPAPGFPVGAGLLAKAVCQRLKCWLTHPLREQARSHRDCGVPKPGENASFNFTLVDRLAHPHIGATDA
jgi:hypothetical protein